jgi:hypothetical protein
VPLQFLPPDETLNASNCGRIFEYGATFQIIDLAIENLFCKHFCEQTHDGKTAVIGI